MGYILFLCSIFISTVYYLRMSKKFDSLDVHLSEDLQKEMDRLILDFNRTAEQNITILEERIIETKNLTQDLAAQINYLKKLKDTLDTELRDLQKSFFTLQEKNNPIITYNDTEPTGYVQKIYTKVRKDMDDIKQTEPFLAEKTDLSTTSKKGNKRTKKNKIDHNLLEENMDTLEINSQDLFSLPDDKKKPSSPILKTKELKPNVPKVETKSKTPRVRVNKKATGTKAKVLEYYGNGLDISSIANSLGLPKGEVQVIVQLFHGQKNSDQDLSLIE